MSSVTVEALGDSSEGEETCADETCPHSVDDLITPA